MIKKDTLENLVKNSKSYTDEKLCPRCGRKMRKEWVENSFSRYADVYICSECGLDEAVRDFNKKVLSFSEWKIVKNILLEIDTVEGRYKFIHCVDSGIYTGTNVDGEDVIIEIQKGKGMNIWTIHAEKPNWWEIVEYNECGGQESVSYKSCR